METVSSARPFTPPPHIVPSSYINESSRSVTTNESSLSGVSWGAVMAGAFGAAALSLALLALGAGIGLSSVSPWSSDGASASSVGWGAIGWMVIMQLLASALGGYLAGRLRTKWVDVHTNEVYFRDTAHGFLTWAVGMVLTATLLTSAAATMVGSAAGAAGATAAVTADSSGDSGGYVIDTMLRSNTPAANAASAPVNGQISGIMANSLRQDSMPSTDRTYLAQLVAARTGVSQAEAEKRVDTADLEARAAADTARKATAHSLYWTFVALLAGAFTASLTATVGGRARDQVIALHA
jgi:hypothetical protein